jgi:hypothetical protein
MSCYETIDSQGAITRHFTNDVTINLTSASTGAGYGPPACTMKPASHGVPEPRTLALTRVTRVPDRPPICWDSLDKHPKRCSEFQAEVGELSNGCLRLLLLLRQHTHNHCSDERT